MSKQKHCLQIMGLKRGMLMHFTEKGESVPCTVIELPPNTIVQLKSIATDGYEALKLGFNEYTCKEKAVENRTTKAHRGQFKKASAPVASKLYEARVSNVEDYEVNQKLGVEVFKECAEVDISAVSKGKGYQGVIKRHGFRGGPGAHGSGFHRHGGSTGMRSTPGRTLPNTKMPGRMGGKQVTVEGLKVLAVDEEKNIMLVKGSIPGPNKGFVMVRKSIKAKA